MRRITCIFMLFAIAAIVIPVWAGADVTVDATLQPSTATVGSEVVLTVSVKGKFRSGATPRLPQLDEFEIFESGSSQNFSFVNGQISSSITYRYVLVPRSEGQFTIPPIKFAFGDKEYQTKPLQLEVLAAASAIAPQQSQAQPQPPSGTAPTKDQSIFISASINRDTVYVNQQVTWTLGYYSDGRVNLLRSPNYTPPPAEGFWVEDLPPQNKYYAQLHGRQYLVNEIKRAYFPTGPGVYRIGEAKVDIVVDDMTARNMIDDFFRRSRGFGQQHSLATEKKEIVVLPLPAAGKPDDFSGIVAEDLKVSMSVDKQVIQVGEPINVTIEINGRGNIKTIAPPSLPTGDDFKVYESGSSSDTFKKDYVVTGRKKYEFVIVPQTEGKQSIPPVRLSYFDPAAGKYSLAKSHSVPLDVHPGAKEEGRKVIYAGGDDFEVINRDIRFIQPVPSTVAMSAGKLYESRFFLALHVLPLLAILGSVFAERRRKRLQDDVGFARSSRALRVAIAKIGVGRKRVAAGDPGAGLAALADALAGYFADKLNAPQAGLTSDDVMHFLESRGVDARLTAEVRQLFADCDAARFGAASTGGDSEHKLAGAETSLRNLEKRYLQ